MDEKDKPKCHNCAGTGHVPTQKFMAKMKVKSSLAGNCLYCNGSGRRTR